MLARRKMFLAGLGWAALCASSVFAQQAGDTIITLRETPLQDGPRLVRTLGTGVILNVQEVQGPWLRTDFPSGSELAGWVQARDVLRIEDASAYFLRQVQANPLDDEAWVALGRVHEHLGRMDAAQGDYAEALRANPRNAFAWEYHGRLRLYENWDYSGASADFDAALRLLPAYEQNSLYLGRVYCLRGLAKLCLEQDQAALADFDLALRYAPKWPFAWYGRGLANEFLGRREQSDRDVARAKEIYPEVEDDPYFDPLWDSML